MDLSTAPTAIVIAAAIFALVIGILWLVLPLAVFGIESKLEKILEIEKLQLENLRALRKQLVDDANQPPAGFPSKQGPRQ